MKITDLTELEKTLAIRKVEGMTETELKECAYADCLRTFTDLTEAELIEEALDHGLTYSPEKS